MCVREREDCERGKGQREKLRKMKKRENKIVYENKIERVYERENEWK